MKDDEKLEVFEYIVFRLLEWQREAKPEELNDLTILKLLKLHFFVCAVDARTNSLLSIFDNFIAAPFGHSERTIYKRIRETKRYEIDSRCPLVVKPEFTRTLEKSFDTITTKVKSEVDTAILNLKTINYSLIKSHAFELVELSHVWYSWSRTAEWSRLTNKLNVLIPSSMIREDTKYFIVRKT